MAVTPNYGWPVPVATDLVKDGYAAIADLGDAIDTTVFGLGDPGLTLINTTTFSAVASQSVNNVFSATYENYRILTNITSQSVDGSYYLKMRVGGADSSVSYYLINGGFTSTNSGYNTNANNQTTGFNLGDIDAAVNDLYGFNGDIMNPFLSVPTRLLGLNNGATTGGTPALQFGGGVHNVATSYTSFTLVAGAGNITGNVKVYGYKK